MNIKNNAKRIQLLSALLFTRDEIETILTDDDDIDDFNKLYEKGRLTGEYETRKALYDKVKTGDMTAQTQWTILKTKLQK